jgi:hypothetical protein
MFLRAHKRRKNGKDHRYFSIVENRRIAGRGPDGKRLAQRTVPTTAPFRPTRSTPSRSGSRR